MQVFFLENNGQIQQQLCLLPNEPAGDQDRCWVYLKREYAEQAAQAIAKETKQEPMEVVEYNLTKLMPILQWFRKG